MILDPLPTGVTTVLGVDFYPDAGRTGTIVAAPVALVDGQWTVDTLNVPAGRWWPTVRAQKGATPYSWPLLPTDLPEDGRLVISPEALAKKMKVPLPLDEDQRETLTDAILEAQDDVVAYLGCAIMPTEKSKAGVWPYGETWDLDVDDPIIRILGSTAEVDLDGDPTGAFTVRYLAGYNARDDASLRPIRRYVLAAALASQSVYDLWMEVVKPEGAVKSLSAEGQSVTFEKPVLVTASGKPGEVGGPPTLASLDYWRVAGRRVHQAASRFGAREP